MQKLNKSVTKCLNPICSVIPTIQLDCQILDPLGGYAATLAQALVCKKDIPHGKTVLETAARKRGYYGSYRITEIQNPRWLQREQAKLSSQSESAKPATISQKEIPIVNKEQAPKDRNAPATREELEALRNKFIGNGRRK